MKTKLFIVLLALVGCSKSSDPIPSEFPSPGLLGTWQEVSEVISNCGKNDGPVNVSSNQRLVLTSTKSTTGNYTGTYQGSAIEYKLNGDSITFIGWKKGIFKLTNVLIITGKFTVINSLTGCDFNDQFQK